MDLLRLDSPLDDRLVEPVIVAALDGWTDAGRAGTLAADTLRAQWSGERIGSFASDGLYDYRDRRPILTIDEGLLGEPVWPALEVWHLRPTAATTPVLLVTGAEPDLAWQTLCADLAELAQLVGASRYVGLGAVPAPLPHTRPPRIITTASDEALLERFGRPHEQLTVPASCQVMVEAALRDAGLTTLGLWCRIPHYVAGEYPAGAHALLQRFAEVVAGSVDLSALRSDAEAHRARLDLAAASSEEILAHIMQLERDHDADVGDGGGFGPLPSGDEIAAELERFLRGDTG